jgi:hypothetical protein
MRHALSAALFAGVFLTSLTPPPALAMPVAKSTTVEASVEKVGYWRRQYRRYWRRGYPVPYAYYPPAYGYYAPPPADAYYPPYGYAPPPPPSGDYGSYQPEYGDGDYPPENGY